MYRWVIRIIQDNRTFYAGSLYQPQKQLCYNVDMATRFVAFDDAISMRSELYRLFPDARHILIDPVKVL